MAGVIKPRPPPGEWLNRQRARPLPPELAAMARHRNFQDFFVPCGRDEWEEAGLKPSLFTLGACAALQHAANFAN